METEVMHSGDTISRLEELVGRVTMKDRPILFSGPMVRAILEGRKTQTRRALKEFADLRHYVSPRISPIDDEWLLERWEKCEREMNNFGRCERLRCPYGIPGDTLWVRETFRSTDTLEFEAYRADIGTDRWNSVVDPDNCKWRPAIFMPRWASRITLEITEVRVQRVQDISEEDIEAEGVTINTHMPNCGALGRTCHCGKHSVRSTFARLWDSINAKRVFGWDANPWVWAITFKRVQ